MSKYYDSYWRKQSKLYDGIYKWPVVSKYLPVNSNLKILDFGCGPGVLLRFMKKKNPSNEYFGADVSSLIIKKNKSKIKFGKFVKIEEGKKLPFRSNFFDFIVTTDVVEHIYDTEFAFREFYRILKPNGRILITTPYHGVLKNLLIVLLNFELIFDPVGPHIRFFTKKSLSKILLSVGLIPKKFDYFGRFYPISSGMLVLAQKKTD